MGDNNKTIEGWAIVELMGHVRLAGRVSEENHFGTVMGRIDIPQDNGTFFTRFFSGNSIHNCTPVTEDVARHIAASDQPRPIAVWEFPKLPAPRNEKQLDDEDDGRPELPF